MMVESSIARAGNRRIVLATGNPGKVEEIRAVLAGLDVDLVSLRDFPNVPEVIEDADTLAGNARKKAEAVYLATGLPALADDTGLEVDALGGAPGVQSARYAGPACNPVANRRMLLDDLAGQVNRAARFRTVIALATNWGTEFFEGVCEGRILNEERGTGGFGYDPLFVPEGKRLTFAEMSAAEKNSISHRGRALQTVRRRLEQQPIVP